MSESEHGHMDISAQKKTYAGFLTTIQWIIGIVAAILIFLAIFNS